jgi:hypothetical protein
MSYPSHLILIDPTILLSFPVKKPHKKMHMILIFDTDPISHIPKNHIYYLTEFRALRKKNFESILEFIQIFNNLYHKILAEVKPSQPTAKVTFAGAFDSDFALLLREIRSTTLAGMKYDDIEIESNMMESRKLKTKVDMGAREPKRFKEHAGPFGFGMSAEEKWMRWPKLLKIYQTKFPGWK